MYISRFVKYKLDKRVISFKKFIWNHLKSFKKSLKSLLLDHFLKSSLMDAMSLLYQGMYILNLNSLPFIPKLNLSMISKHSIHLYLRSRGIKKLKCSTYTMKWWNFSDNQRNDLQGSLCILENWMVIQRCRWYHVVNAKVVITNVRQFLTLKKKRNRQRI
jgi:hypothetical protein